MSDRVAFKVLTPAQWAVFSRSESFAGSPVDLADGYIHMSDAATLLGTLNKWYADQTQVEVLAIDLSGFGAELKWEVSRGGAKFPHLYAALPRSVVERRWTLRPDSHGHYTLPDDLKAE